MSNEKKILTVSEITRLIKFSLESSFPLVWIQGEVSNYKVHTSGHVYFTLKDEGAQISAVMWRNRAANLLFKPEDGMKVVVQGGITVYPNRGNYQIDVLYIQPLGIGELQLAFEKLKKKLQEEGLFDPARKRPIPAFPESIGVITSETGAAIQDIKSILKRRFPSLELILFPVSVQGPTAAEEIASAIYEMNRFGKVDVLIVGRGGSSLEDLWAFNEEIVARAIYSSKIPVISAVGHEIDFSISDFVADVRAPTPSAAAEMVVKRKEDVLDIIRNICYTMQENLENRISQFQNKLQSLISSYSFNRPKDLVLQFMQRVDEIERSMSLILLHRFELIKTNYLSLQQRLDSLGPERVLKRGYTMIRKDERIITSSYKLNEDDLATIQFHDGYVPVRVRK